MGLHNLIVEVGFYLNEYGRLIYEKSCRTPDHILHMCVTYHVTLNLDLSDWKIFQWSVILYFKEQLDMYLWTSYWRQLEIKSGSKIVIVIKCILGTQTIYYILWLLFVSLGTWELIRGFLVLPTAQIYYVQGGRYIMAPQKSDFQMIKDFKQNPIFMIILLYACRSLYDQILFYIAA